jgi:hypothetical protein
MMFVLGITLFGTTLLLPQYLQTIMGYSAQDAGMALSPGGFLIMIMMPGVGLLMSRVDARGIIAVGFVILSASMFYMASHLYPTIDFGTAVKVRAFQSVAMACLFVPINTLVYADVPREKSNAVSGIINLSRNMGGDVGIALATTFIARRAQVHQSYLSAHTNATGRYFEAHLHAMSDTLMHRGLPAVDASRRALASLYGQVVEQATTLAYVDVLRGFGVLAGIMVPLLLLTRPPKKGEASVQAKGPLVTTPGEGDDQPGPRADRSMTALPAEPMAVRFIPDHGRASASARRTRQLRVVVVAPLLRGGRSGPTDGDDATGLHVVTPILSPCREAPSLFSHSSARALRSRRAASEARGPGLRAA